MVDNVINHGSKVLYFEMYRKRNGVNYMKTIKMDNQFIFAWRGTSHNWNFLWLIKYLF